MSDLDSNSHNLSDKKWYQDRSLQLTLLGVVGTIVAAVISILPQFISNNQQPEPTQTAIIWTATVVEPPTATDEPVLPTDTAPPAPTDTATPSPTPTLISPPISCLDRWQVISSDSDPAETNGTEDCAVTSIPALGISASKAGISFGINNFRDQGTFGLATSLPADATVTLTVDLTVLSQGEFWIAISNSPTPQENMAIVALQTQLGDVRVYENQTNTFTGSYSWEQLSSDTGLADSLPYSFDIKLTTLGNKINPQIHFFNLPPVIVNLPNFLFVGYHKKSTLGSVTLQVDISNLSVEIE